MINIIKVRDDHSPIQFKQDSTDSAKYSLCDGVERDGSGNLNNSYKWYSAPQMML